MIDDFLFEHAFGGTPQAPEGASDPLADYRRKKYLEDLMITGLKGYGAYKVANKVEDELLPRLPVIGKYFENKKGNEEDAKRRLELVQLARKLKVNPADAMKGDFLEKYYS